MIMHLRGYASALSLVDTLLGLCPQYIDTFWGEASTDDGSITTQHGSGQ